MVLYSRKLAGEVGVPVAADEDVDVDAVMGEEVAAVVAVAFTRTKGPQTLLIRPILVAIETMERGHLSHV